MNRRYTQIPRKRPTPYYPLKEELEAGARFGLCTYIHSSPRAALPPRDVQKFIAVNNRVGVSFWYSNSEASALAYRISSEKELEVWVAVDTMFYSCGLKKLIGIYEMSSM